MAYGNLLTDVVQSSTTGTPPVFKDGNGTEVGTLCRAWVQFTGSTATKNGSYNVSSVTRTGAGNYTINFTNAMPDTNYGIVFGCTSDFALGSGTSLFSGSSASRDFFYNSINTTSCTFICGYLYSASTLADFTNISIAIFR